ncbi:cell division activator CedA, partial [Escherichia sp. HC-CC]
MPESAQRWANQIRQE